MPSLWLTGWPPIIQTSPFKNALMPRKVIAMIMLVVRVTTNKVLYDSGDNNLLQDVGGIGTFRDVARA